MSIFITAYQGRTVSEQITFKNADGSNATLPSGSKVRVKIGRGSGNATPLLDIVSGTAFGSGSYVTATNPATLELVGADLLPARIKPGVYDIDAIVVDHNDSDRDKLAEQGTFSLVSAQGGNTG